MENDKNQTEHKTTGNYENRVGGKNKNYIVNARLRSGAFEKFKIIKLKIAWNCVKNSRFDYHDSEVLLFHLPLQS